MLWHFDAWYHCSLLLTPQAEKYAAIPVYVVNGMNLVDPTPRSVLLTSVIGPIIDEVDDELNAIFLCSFNNSIQSLEAICSCIDGCSRTREGLEVDSAGTWNGFHVVESPYSENLVARGLEVRHNDINIIVIGEKGNPVTICAGIVCRLVRLEQGKGLAEWLTLGYTVNVELGAISFRD